MDEKMREKMISALEKAVNVVGAKDYETGMKQAMMFMGFANRFTEFANSFLPSIQTIEGLRKMLDSQMALPECDETMLLFALENLPQLLRAILKMTERSAGATLPPPPGGRPPALTAKRSQEVLEYILQLLRKGNSLGIAKDRASQEFGCSRRTIERLWANRGSVPADEPTIEGVLSRFFREIDLSEEWKFNLG